MELHATPSVRFLAGIRPYLRELEYTKSFAKLLDVLPEREAHAMLDDLFRMLRQVEALGTIGVDSVSEAPATKRCECGWLRPLICVTTLRGPAPTEDVVPVYPCPVCGKPYVPEEISEDLGRRILGDLFAVPEGFKS